MLDHVSARLRTKAPGTTNNRKFYKGLQALRDFVERENTVYVPYNHYEDGVPLRLWCDYARSRFYSWPQERIDALESIPGWSWRRPKYEPRPEKAKARGSRGGRYPTTTRRWIMRLEAFYKEMGHCYPTLRNKDKAENKGLGYWVYEMRRRHREGVLHPEDLALLNEIPWWKWTHEEAKTEYQAMEKPRSYGISKRKAIKLTKKQNETIAVFRHIGLEFLDIRIKNALTTFGLKTIEDVLNLTAKELSEIPGLGGGAVKQIEHVIQRLGLRLRPAVPR